MMGGPRGRFPPRHGFPPRPMRPGGPRFNAPPPYPHQPPQPTAILGPDGKIVDYALPGHPGTAPPGAVHPSHMPPGMFEEAIPPPQGAPPSEMPAGMFADDQPNYSPVFQNPPSPPPDPSSPNAEQAATNAPTSSQTLLDASAPFRSPGSDTAQMVTADGAGKKKRKVKHKDKRRQHAKGKRVWSKGDAKAEIAKKIKMALHTYNLARNDFKAIAKKCTDRLTKHFMMKQEKKPHFHPAQFMNERRMPKIHALCAKYVQALKKQ